MAKLDPNNEIDRQNESPMFLRGKSIGVVKHNNPPPENLRDYIALCLTAEEALEVSTAQILPEAVVLSIGNLCCHRAYCIVHVHSQY